MLKINQIDLKKEYPSQQEELKATKSYIYQLVEELRYRLKDPEPEEDTEEEDKKKTEEIIGEAVRGSYKYLETEGLDADWITTGILQSKDGSFWFDLDNGLIVTDSLKMFLTDQDDKSLSTIISATAAGISAAATKTEVNALSQTVSEHSATLTFHADEIATKVSQTDFDDLGDIVSEAQTEIQQTAQQIALKASQTDFDALSGRVVDAEAELVVQAGQIATKVSQTEVNALTGRVSAAESSISQTATQIATKVSQSDFNTLTGRVSTAESTITQTATAVASKVSQSDFNTLSGTVSSQASTISQHTTDISLRVTTETFNKEKKDIRDYADGVLQDFVEGEFATTIEDIQNQLDGNITSWFYDYNPEAELAPECDWRTTVQRNEHLGDIFYNTATGTSYRYVRDDTRQDDVFTDRNGDTLTTRDDDELVTGIYYFWLELADSGVAEALRIASLAKDTADGKRRVFVVTPVTPYDEGDLWSDGDDIYRCINSKETGAYNSSDWELATNYKEGIAQNAAAIEILDQNIQLKVSTTDFTGQNIASLINATPDTIFIGAKHIELKGGNVAKAINDADSTVKISAGHIDIESSDYIQGLDGRISANTTNIGTTATGLSTAVRQIEAIDETLSEWSMFEPYRTEISDTMLRITARLYDADKNEITQQKASTWYQYYIVTETGSEFVGTGYSINIPKSKAGLTGGSVLCIYQEHEDRELTDTNENNYTLRNSSDPLTVRVEI